MTPSCPVRRSDGAPGTSRRPPCGPVVRANAGREGQGDSRPASTALAESTATVRARPGAMARAFVTCRGRVGWLACYLSWWVPDPRDASESTPGQWNCRTVAPACALDRGGRPSQYRPRTLLAGPCLAQAAGPLNDSTGGHRRRSDPLRLPFESLELVDVSTVRAEFSRAVVVRAHPPGPRHRLGHCGTASLRPAGPESQPGWWVVTTGCWGVAPRAAPGVARPARACATRSSPCRWTRRRPTG